MNQRDRYLIGLTVAIVFCLLSLKHPFAQYADVTGSPGTGAHSVRVAGFSMVDIYMTMIGSAIIGLWKKWKVCNVFCILLLLSIPVHLMFGVKTALVAGIF